MRGRSQISESNGESSDGPPALASAQHLERGRIGESSLGPALDLDRHQPGRLGHRRHLLGRHPVVHGQIGHGGHAERPSSGTHQPGDAFLVAQFVPSHLVGNGPLDQVVDALKPPALAAHQITDVQQPFGRDLDLGPVPPRAALLGPTQLLSRQRALGSQARHDLAAALVLVFEVVPAPALGPAGPALEGVGRPLRQRQETGGVRPVLEGGAARAPVGGLDPFPADGSVARVRHQFM